MAKAQIGQGYAAWYSTYGSLTAGRVLEYFNIRLSQDALIDALTNTASTYYNVLRVPMMNIFNGIILQQAYDYQVYAQKLLIDYRLSTEYAKDAESPGANTRDDLNEEYDALLAQTTAFHEQQLTHYRLISKTQEWLMTTISALPDPSHDLGVLEHDALFEEKIGEFVARATEIAITFRSYRSQFYDRILRITERLGCLQEYAFDLENAERERESLHFDAKIGGA